MPDRNQIISAIEGRDHPRALVLMRQLFNEAPTPANAQFVLKQTAPIREHLALVPYRLAILRSFTIEPVVPILRAMALFHGIDLTVQVGAFNAYSKELLDSGSDLYGFNPDVVILATQTRDVLPELWNDVAEDADAVAARAAANIELLIDAPRSRSNAHLILNTLEMPAYPNAGILDSQRNSGQCEAIRTVNRRLREAAARHRGVYVLDYDALIARYGRLGWSDESKWLTMRMPLGADSFVHLAREYIRFLLPLCGRVCKALVIDLDNTIWGGIVGEDGLDGIKLGAEYPGNAYLEVQRAILDLHRRGIILAICSKNNSADALEVFQGHDAMLLRLDHFAATRINWKSKAENIRELARELNIGIDALAFLDDNPLEREEVRMLLPEVHVIDLPAGPAQFAAALRSTPVFERLTLSQEDRDRGTYYMAEQQRAQLQSGSVALDDYYRSLGMEVEIGAVTARTLARVAQLTQKTNQFNLTTRRYSEQEIAAKAADARWRVDALTASDRFGDYGLVGVAITSRDGEVCEIDSFLLSCRVIGRSVETALLSYIAREAAAGGMRTLRGWYLPTRKNAPSKDFYPKHGFRMINEGEGKMQFEYDLSNELGWPEWVKLRSEGSASR
ncbi:HAD-IIIC family phosphatase [Candidatus Binatus sp.]|uniref:HAD-IIIC family phosphatase n=1 Tax=Candidatus Binatus sp. TaxID=2811406 RepID=UPI003CC65D89